MPHTGYSDLIVLVVIGVWCIISNVVAASCEQAQYVLVSETVDVVWIERHIVQEHVDNFPINIFHLRRDTRKSDQMDGLIGREELLALGTTCSSVLLSIHSVILLMMLCVVLCAERNFESIKLTGPGPFYSYELLFAVRRTEMILNSDNDTSV